MGGNAYGRVLRINNLQDQYEQCDRLAEQSSPIYGETELVRYTNMNFYIARSQTEQEPHSQSLHYLIQPQNILVYPEFTLLEDIGPDGPNELFNIIDAICEMALMGKEPCLGIGYKRLGFGQRWGVAGEQPTSWAYDQVFEGGPTEGVFFSPQMMIQLSQGRRNPRYDLQKADVFALGLMLVEIVFGESMGHIYDYDNFEIKLNPLLEKLQEIREQWKDDVANMFVCMLEIEEEDRVDFAELKEMVEVVIHQFQQPRGPSMLQSGSSHRNQMEYSRGNRTPGRQQQAPQAPFSVRTPTSNNQGKYRNDVSPFRGRFGGAVKNNSNQAASRRTPEQVNRSPMRRNRPGNARPERETFGMHRNVSPSGARNFC